LIFGKLYLLFLILLNILSNPIGGSDFSFLKTTPYDPSISVIRKFSFIFASETFYENKNCRLKTEEAFLNSNKALDVYLILTSN